MSGKLNEGLFNESYAFIKEVQDERLSTLKASLSQAKKEGDKERATQIRDLIGHEKDFKNKNNQNKKEKETLNKIK